ncbi:MAG: endo-1,4-beta-xylanase [Bacteroidales bacterium]|nr:endo-1,4-beta-xylanase [Bacteroidales bacterium]MCF8338429.1 endo-1,4-beta-xylanase [Bacteroidales bacterium]
MNKTNFTLSTITLVILILSSPNAFGQSKNEVPSDYIKHFLGAAHLKTEYHPYAESTGVTWARLGTRWHEQEPEKDVYDFESYDRLVESAEKHGIKILPLIGHTAEWAADAPEGENDKNRYPPRDDMIDQWKEYVEKVVERYPDIEYFEVWNEANIDWFFRVDTNYKVYVEKILIPAAEVIHAHGRKVAGPSFTTEWPLDSWPPKKRPRKHAENVASNIRDINRWLSYENAWKYIDILAVHYTHGDVSKPSQPYADNMMRFYDYVYTHWIKPGKIEGIWNTEAGFAGTEAGMQGFVGLDPWEKPPYPQWVARYVIPPIHWAINHNWSFRDQYKLFWYHMSVGDHPRDMLTRKNGKIVPSERGKALHTISKLFTSADTVGIYPHRVRTGFGIFSKDTAAINYFAPYEFKNYAFKLGNKLMIAVWANLPRKEAFGQDMQVMIEGLPDTGDYEISKIHYINGNETALKNYTFKRNNTMHLKVPPNDEPIIYLVIEPK